MSNFKGNIPIICLGFLFCFVFDVHLQILRITFDFALTDNSWQTYGTICSSRIELGCATCKENTLPTVPSLKLPDNVFCGFFFVFLWFFCQLFLALLIQRTLTYALALLNNTKKVNHGIRFPKERSIYLRNSCFWISLFEKGYCLISNLTYFVKLVYSIFP